MIAKFKAIVWRLFPWFEKLGVHILPVHFYSPIPDTGYLRSQTGRWKKPNEMPGVDLQPKVQIETLKSIVEPRQREYLSIGQAAFGVDAARMTSYAPINALTLFAYIRHFQPARLIEVGSGMSSQIIAASLKLNTQEQHPATYTVIDPYPTSILQKAQGVIQIDFMKSKVEDVSPEVFSRLERNDILFIDSSHTVKIFGDVNFLFLQILPILKPGVIVHIHDIFFPFDYLPHHFFSAGFKQIWQEQYLLHAFLIGNKEWEVLQSNSWLHYYERSELERMFPWYNHDRWPSSFWMRKNLNQNRIA